MSLFDARFAAYLAVAALLIVTPGPDTALVTRNALRAGRRAATFTTLGIGAGSVVWAFASVFGIATLLEQSALAFTIWKVVGAAYLIYLGVRSLLGLVRGRRSGAPDVAASAAAMPAAQAGKPLARWQPFGRGCSAICSTPKRAPSSPRRCPRSSSRATRQRACC